MWAERERRRNVERGGGRGVQEADSGEVRPGKPVSVQHGAAVGRRRDSVRRHAASVGTEPGGGAQSGDRGHGVRTVPDVVKKEREREKKEW